ncbi:MAG TPA: ABC transporter substrate-binding protein [Candidatus Dormibacteraeota bacterium]|nr:ABC transporter substrate-binding protein [Candidatus Dormibacteraeota bacterium]
MKVHQSTRREFIRGAAAAGAGAVLIAGVRPGAADAAGQLVVTDPGGEWEAAASKAYYLPFQQASGTHVTFGARASLAIGQLKAMVESHNVQWDVTDLSDYLISRAGKAGLLEPIDYSSMDTAGMLKDAMMKYGVGNDAYATIMAYSTKKWAPGKGPQSWADFWDVKRFPGRRSLSGIGYGPMEFALLADGVPKDKLYPLDVKRALNKMDEIKPHINVWWTTGAQQAQLMLDGEVDLIEGWNGRLYAGITKGAPFHMEWSQGSYEWEGWVIPKGAANAKEAQKFIGYAMNAKQQAIYASNIAYGPSNQKAFSYIPKDRAALLPTYGPNLEKLFRVDADWLADHLDELTAAWTQWRAG